MRRIALLAFLSLIAAACTPTLNARSVSFHDGVELGGKSFAVVAEAGQENNLEFRHYAEMVNRHLHRYGLVQAPSLDSADYRVSFSYGVDGGQQQIIQRAPRVYGGYYGGFGHRSYTGIGMGFPIYGGGAVESYTRYTRMFELRMVQNARARNTVYQGRVTSTGESNSLPALLPCMIAALFQNFPGPSGREVSISLPRNSCDA